MVCRFPVITESPKGDFVMYVQLSPMRRLADAATLAHVLVAIACLAGLYKPIVSTVVVAAAIPCWTIWATHIPRSALPFESAFYRTEIVFACFLSAGKPPKLLPAHIANEHRSFNVLGMRLAQWPMGGKPLAVTRLATESMIQLGVPAWLAKREGATLVARNLNGSSLGIIPAGHTTELLLRMFHGGKKHFAALWARLVVPLDSRLVRTSNRTEPHCSVGAYCNVFSAAFTFSHSHILP